MLDRKSKQTGFGAVLGLLLVVVVCAVVGAGWLTYSHYHKLNQVKQTTNAATTPSSTPSTTKTPVTVKQSTTVANQNVVKIPELGIQITVPDSIKDLTYQVHTGTLQNGNQATFAFFSTAALTAADAYCGPGAAPLGSLEEASGQYPSSDPLAVGKYGQLVKQFPTFYISHGVPQGACSTNSTISGDAGGGKSAFEAALTSMQQSSS